MKKIVSFRLDEDLIFMLEVLAQEYETTKVHILENAIKNYVTVKKFKKKNLMKFYGKLDKKDVKKFKELI